MERDLVPRAGYRLYAIRVRGLNRGVSLGLAVALGSLPLAALDALRLLRSFRPHCVVGVGAYASGPVVAEAALMGIPTVAIEMDSHMGWTNRILSRLVDRVCLSFPDGGHQNRRFIYTGRPVRPALLLATKEQAVTRFGLDPHRPVVLVVGGSLGARSLNRAALEAFAVRPTSYHVIHVTGRRDFYWVSKQVGDSTANPLYQFHAFLEDYPLALAAANVVVSRAGGSVAEILVRGVPAILVPYPLAAGDHQTKNAKTLEQAGAAVVVPDQEINGRRLVDAVERLLDPETNENMRQAALRLARPDSTERICDIIEQLIAGRSRKGK